MWYPATGKTPKTCGEREEKVIETVPLSKSENLHLDQQGVFRREMHLELDIKRIIL